MDGIGIATPQGNIAFYLEVSVKLKDLAGLSIISIFLFPVVLVTVMLATGVVHLELGDKKTKTKLDQYLQRYTPAQDRAEAEQMKTFQALEEREKKLAIKEREINEKIEQLENLKLETMNTKEDILRNRKRIEQLVAQSDELQEKRLKSLAEVYGSMRPEEAAPILLTLEDGLVVRILQKIPETRSTSKTLAALAALDVGRAARLTKLMGENTVKDN